MNITYTQNGDYLIPNIVIRKTKPIGHYGRLRKAYLEMHRPILFNELVLSDKLFEHCAEIDEAARNRMELIVRSLAEQNGVTEQLKAKNQMEWVRQMNACKVQAEARPSQILCKGCKQPGFAALDIRLRRRYGREKAHFYLPAGYFLAYVPAFQSFFCFFRISCKFN